MMRRMCVLCLRDTDIGDLDRDGICSNCTPAQSRIDALESALAERERECERLRKLLDDALDGALSQAKELTARAESAESALAAAREENGKFRRGRKYICRIHGTIHTDDETGGDLAWCPICAAKNSASEVKDLRAELAAAREENERLRGKLEATKGWVPAAKADIDRAVESSLRARDEGRVERLEDALRRWGVGGSMRDAILSAAADGEVKP